MHPAGMTLAMHLCRGNFRIDQVVCYVPLAQLALISQCGLASTEEGNVLTSEQQRAKLALVVEVAQKVWGGA